jgi:hypothetical protein
MTDIRTLLRQADPLAESRADADALTAGDARELRHAILAAARDIAPAPLPWRRPLAFAAVATALTVLGGMIGLRSSVPPDAPADGAAIADSTTEVECRQLQFATPGGTRIIWIFDDNARFQESMP